MGYVPELKVTDWYNYLCNPVHYTLNQRQRQWSNSSQITRIVCFLSILPRYVF